MCPELKKNHNECLSFNDMDGLESFVVDRFRVLFFGSSSSVVNETRESSCGVLIN
jgi:hypothetical protein